MAQEIGALRAMLSATSAVFEKDMRDAKNSVRRHGRDMQRGMATVNKGFSTAMRSLRLLAATAGATATVGGFAVFIKKQIDAADAIGKMAQATGNSTEFLSAMGFVAEQTGTSLDTIAKSTQRLAKNMDDFRRGAGEARYAFEDLGLTITDGNGNLRRTEDVLLDIADKFQGLQDGAEKTNLAIRLFGRSGAELIPMLNQGRDGIEQLTAKAREMGLVIGQDTANQAAYLNDQLNVLKNQAVGFGRELAVSMLPTLNEAVKVIREAYEESGLLSAAWVGLSFAAEKAFNSTDDKIRAVTKQIEVQKQVVEDFRAKVAEAEGRDWSDKGWLSGLINRGFHDDSNKEMFAKNAQHLEELRRQLQDLEKQKAEEGRKDEERLQASIDRMRREGEARAAATAALRSEAEERARLRQASAEAKAQEDARIRASEAATKAIEDQIRTLETQRDTFSMTTREATLYKMEMMDGITPAQMEHIDGILQSIEAMEKQQDAMKEIGDTVDKTEDRFKDLERAIEGWGRSSARAIADFAVDGKASFADLAASIIKDMIAMFVYQQILKPIFGAASGMFSGSGGGVDIRSTSYNSGMPGRASGGPVSPYQAYVVGERGPEVLQMGGKGGYVHPNGAGGGGVVNNIHISGPEQPTVTEQQNSTGGQDIMIFFEEAIAGSVMSGRGPLHKAMRKTFGAQPRLTR